LDFNYQPQLHIFLILILIFINASLNDRIIQSTKLQQLTDSSDGGRLWQKHVVLTEKIN
jgi:hypothetical protein